MQKVPQKQKQLYNINVDWLRVKEGVQVSCTVQITEVKTKRWAWSAGEAQVKGEKSLLAESRASQAPNRMIK